METAEETTMERLMDRLWPSREWTGWADLQHGIRHDVAVWWHWQVMERISRIIRPPCPGCGCKPVSRRYDQRLSHERHCPNGPRAQVAARDWS